mgnify:CR=1 FL=1
MQVKIRITYRTMKKLFNNLIAMFRSAAINCNDNGNKVQIVTHKFDFPILYLHEYEYNIVKAVKDSNGVSRSSRLRTKRYNSDNQPKKYGCPIPNPSKKNPSPKKSITD